MKTLSQLSTDLNRALREYPELADLPVKISVDGLEDDIDNVDLFAEGGVVLENAV